MVNGKIAFSAGSTVPTVEALNVKLAPREVKIEAEADGQTTTVEPAKIEDITMEDAGEQAEKGENKAPDEATEQAEPTQAAEAQDEVVVKTEPQDEPEAVAAPREDKPSLLPGSLFVGDLRLGNLKSRLSNLSPPIAAEFAGEGVLICGPGIHQGGAAKGGSVVAVRKLAQGEIVLEGAIGRTYDAVRRELYKGFARVVAS